MCLFGQRRLGCPWSAQARRAGGWRRGRAAAACCEGGESEQGGVGRAPAAVLSRGERLESLEPAGRAAPRRSGLRAAAAGGQRYKERARAWARGRGAADSAPGRGRAVGVRRACSCCCCWWESGRPAHARARAGSRLRGGARRTSTGTARRGPGEGSAEQGGRRGRASKRARVVRPAWTNAWPRLWLPRSLRRRASWSQWQLHSLPPSWFP